MNILESFDTVIAFVTVLTICSMFVLIVVQMVSATLSLRGKNLANALAQTFQTVSPELKEKAHQLAQRILSDPLLSDSMWKDKQHYSTGDVTQTEQWSALSFSAGAVSLANAIRPQEVLAALQRLSELKEPAAAEENATDAQKKAAEAAKAEWDKQKNLYDAAGVLLKAAGVPEAVAKDKLSAVLTIVDSVSDDTLKGDLTKAVSEASDKLVSVIQTAEGQLTSWLNSAQDRAQQWFQMQTRNITIAASILFAFICRIDAVDLFHHVSTDAKAREALVDASAKIVAEEGDVLDEKGGLPARVAEAWNKKANADAIIPVNLAWKEVAEVRADVEKKVRANATKDGKEDAANVKAGMDAYAVEEKAAVKAYFAAKEDRLKQLQSTLGATGYELFPKAGRWNEEGDQWLYHIPGMLLFAGLLSLGAPYWFNLLKNLASLRPALSKLVGEDRQVDNAPKK
jgi:hypothetical protein